MKSKTFLRIIFFIAVTSAFNNVLASSDTLAKEKQIYEWRVYTLKGDSKVLDDFFKDVLIPEYNRQGVSVGVFSPYNEEKDDLRYLLFTYSNLDSYYKATKNALNNIIHSDNAKSFFEITATAPAYLSYETYLCEAFDKVPVMLQPEKNRTLFELRIYHSPNEDAGQRKINMFNAEEIDLFDKVGIHSVCYGEVLAGLHMPALIYLTWHLDESVRNEAWKKFMSHPDWEKMRNKTEYLNTVTDAKVILLSPLPYSQL